MRVVPKQDIVREFVVGMKERLALCEKSVITTLRLRHWRMLELARMPGTKHVDITTYMAAISKPVVPAMVASVPRKVRFKFWGCSPPGADGRGAFTLLLQGSRQRPGIELVTLIGKAEKKLGK